MRKFLQNKLWRDKAVEALEAEGSKLCWRRLDDVEYASCIRDKLIEEANEVASAQSKAELIEELADVCEVVEALAEASGVTAAEIRAAQFAKRVLRGGFAGRWFVEWALHPRGSRGEQYCLAQPHKYPEIT